MKKVYSGNNMTQEAWINITRQLKSNQKVCIFRYGTEVNGKKVGGYLAYSVKELEANETMLEGALREQLQDFEIVLLATVTPRDYQKVARGIGSENIRNVAPYLQESFREELTFKELTGNLVDRGLLYEVISRTVEVYEDEYVEGYFRLDKDKGSEDDYYLTNTTVQYDLGRFSYDVSKVNIRVNENEGELLLGVMGVEEDDIPIGKELIKVGQPITPDNTLTIIRVNKGELLEDGVLEGNMKGNSYRRIIEFVARALVLATPNHTKSEYMETFRGRDLGMFGGSGEATHRDRLSFTGLETLRGKSIYGLDVKDGVSVADKIMN